MWGRLWLMGSFFFALFWSHFLAIREYMSSPVGLPFLADIGWLGWGRGRTSNSAVGGVHARQSRDECRDARGSLQAVKASPFPLSPWGLFSLVLPSLPARPLLALFNNWTEHGCHMHIHFRQSKASQGRTSAVSSKPRLGQTGLLAVPDSLFAQKQSHSSADPTNTWTDHQRTLAKNQKVCHCQESNLGYQIHNLMY